MPIYPIRFLPGQGLQLAAAERGQTGLRDLTNADVTLRDCVQLRNGASDLALIKVADPPEPIPPGDVQAIYYRGDELLLETRDSLYWYALEGLWRTAAQWTRTTCAVRNLLLVDSTVLDGDVARVELSDGGVATIATFDTQSGAGEVRIFGAGRDRFYVLSALVAGGLKRPRATTYELGKGVITGRDTSDQLRFAIWEVGPVLSFQATGIAVFGPQYAWDVTGGTSGGQGVIGWIACTAAGTVTITLRRDDGATLTHVINTGLANIQDVALHLQPPAAGAPETIVGSFAIGAPNNLVSGVVTFDFAGSLVTPGFSYTYVHNRGTVHAVACAAIGTSTVRAWYEVDSVNQASFRKVHMVNVSNGLAIELRFVERAALLSQLVVLDTQVLGGLVLYSSDGIQRSGVALLSHFGGEYVGRVNLQRTESNSARPSRGPKRSLGVEDVGGVVTLGEKAIYPGEGAQRAQVITWTRGPLGHAPAAYGNTLVAAHGGYPRCYDGQAAFEQDWHELVQVRTASPIVANPGLAAGVYGVAVTWEATDASGQLYRSAPTLASVTIGTNQTVQVTVTPILSTERPEVKAVLWRTVVNGTEYFRDLVLDAKQDVSALTFVLASVAEEALKAREQLTTVPPEALLPSQPTACTDFMALAGGRLWTRDPEYTTVLRHSLPPVLGYAAIWNDTQVLEIAAPGPVTGVTEIDGSVAIFTRDGVSVTTSLGPSQAGQGAFPEPAVIPVDTGALRQETLAVVEQGVLFGSAEGLRLLDRGRTVQDASSAIEAEYEVQGATVARVLYDPATETAFVGNVYMAPATGRGLRIHLGSGRWALDGRREYVDMDRSLSGEIALLTADGRVLVESDARHDDDGAIYPLVIESPWVRATGDTSETGFVSRFNFKAVRFFGTYLSPHNMTLEIYSDDNRAVPVAVATLPAATVAAQAAAAEPYNYGLELGTALEVYAVKVVLTLQSPDQASAGALARLEAIELEWQPQTAAGPLELPGGHLLVMT